MNATPYAGTPDHLRAAGNIVEPPAASAEAFVENRGASQLVGSGSLVRAIQALRAAEVCIMRTIETREEEPEIAGRVLKIALENIETAKGHLCPNKANSTTCTKS